MGLVISILLFAAGAITTWAAGAYISGVELTVIGWILIAVGGVWSVLSLIQSP